jgi:hypothetical protein
MTAVVIAQIWRGCFYADKPGWRHYTAQNRLFGDEVARESSRDYRGSNGINMKG